MSNAKSPAGWPEAQQSQASGTKRRGFLGGLLQREKPSDAAPKRSLLDRLRGKETPHQDKSHTDEQPQQPKADLPFKGPTTNNAEKEEALNKLVKLLNAANVSTRLRVMPTEDEFHAMCDALEKLHPPDVETNEISIWKQVQKRYGQKFHVYEGITREDRNRDEKNVLLLFLVVDTLYYRRHGKFATEISARDPRRAEALDKFPFDE
ncbi:MAG: hypothetical protein Q9159_003098 [Coniocarpon cinnabarinum]